MRILTIIIIICLAFSCSEKKNTRTEIRKKTEIDSISGLNEIREFVKKIDSSSNKFLCIMPTKYNTELYANSMIRKRLDSMFSDFSFIKEDFDNNGLTDLIVTGESYNNDFRVIGIMSLGKGEYSIIPLTLSDFKDSPVYPKLVYKNKMPVIELYSFSRPFENSDNGISKATLVYKYGIFIDYNDPSEDYQISKIEYKAEGCFGACPVFELILNENTESVFKAKYYNFNRDLKIEYGKEEGCFEVMIDKEKYNEICQIINYLQIKNLSHSYFSGGTDQPSCTLSVYFTDGTIKTIEDYGKTGTNGLRYLYRKLSDLRFNQEWKEQ